MAKWENPISDFLKYKSALELPFIISVFIGVLRDPHNCKKKGCWGFFVVVWFWLVGWFAAFFFILVVFVGHLFEFAKMSFFIHRLSTMILQNRSALGSCDMNCLGLLFVLGGSSVTEVEICLFKVHAFGMDSELLLYNCCCRTNRNKLGMNLRCLDRGFGPAAFEHLQQPQSPPRSASSHCTCDSDSMAFSSPLFWGRRCGLTSVPLDNNPGVLASLSPVTKPTGQLFMLRLGLDCSFDTKMYLIINIVKSSLRRRFSEPELSPASLLRAKPQRMFILNHSNHVLFIWGLSRSLTKALAPKAIFADGSAFCSMNSGWGLWESWAWGGLVFLNFCTPWHRESWLAGTRHPPKSQLFLKTKEQRAWLHPHFLGLLPQLGSLRLGKAGNDIPMDRWELIELFPLPDLHSSFQLLVELATFVILCWCYSKLKLRGCEENPGEHSSY